MDPGEASRTAVLVCQGRAVAHGRLAPGRFDDPTARDLLRPDERADVDAARADTPPSGMTDRMGYEMLRASAQVAVPRTVAIDDAVRGHPTPQLVILGAGLDDRAWRLPALADTDVFEVDHPASQRDKQDRVAALASLARSLVFVPVDFTRDSLEEALATAGHVIATPTTWIWEGVIPYLSRDQIEATIRVVHHRSSTGSRLVVNYQSPSVVAAAGRIVARVMTTLSRRADPLRHEPRRSAWTAPQLSALLATHGFVTETDDDLLTLAGRLGMTIDRGRSLSSGRVAVAELREN